MKLKSKKKALLKSQAITLISKKYSKLAVLAFISANIIWGSAAPIYKWAFEDIHPYTLAFFRFAIPAVIIGIFAWKHLKIKVKHIPLIICIGLMDVTFNIGLYYLGIQHTKSINGPIIGSSGPVFLILGSMLFLHEKPTRKILFGNLVGLTGVLFIVMQPILQTAQNGGTVVGNLLIIGATLASTIGTLLSKKARPHYPAVTILFWSFTIGSLGFLPFFAQEVARYGLLPHLSMQGIIGLTYGTVLSSIVGYSLYYWAVKYIVASEISIFSYMDPVAAILIAGPLLNEHPTIIFFLGALMVFAGIYVAEGRIHYHPLHLLLR